MPGWMATSCIHAVHLTGWNPDEVKTLDKELDKEIISVYFC